MRPLRSLFVALTLLVACEGSGGGGDGGVPDGLAPRSGLVIVEEQGLTATEFSRVLCAKIAECDGGELGAITQNECALYFALPCFFFATLTAEDGLAECIASIRSGQCRNGNVVSDVCQAAFLRARARETGIPLQTKALGPCGDGVECDDGMICGGAFGAAGCGVCTPLPRVGESCEGTSCLSGYCDDRTQICTEKKPDGAECTVDEECGSYECDTGVCKSLVATHGCTLDTHCPSGRCEDGQCFEPGPPGSSCESGLECEEGICDDGVCKLVARCSLGEAGEGCGPIGCRGNLQCVGGVCTQPMAVPGPIGAACNGPDDCSSGYCDFIGGGAAMCAAKELGSTCDADDQCDSGSCVGFRCAGTGACVE